MKIKIVHQRKYDPVKLTQEVVTTTEVKIGSFILDSFSNDFSIVAKLLTEGRLKNPSYNQSVSHCKGDEYQFQITKIYDLENFHQKTIFLQKLALKDLVRDFLNLVIAHNNYSRSPEDNGVEVIELSQEVNKKILLT